MSIGTGGLATGLSNCENIYFASIFNQNDLSINNNQYLENKILPLYISKEEYDIYYNNFSNSILWPLFHSKEIDLCSNKNSNEFFKVYERVNQNLALQILEYISKLNINNYYKVTIWVHDYHLFLLPYFLKKNNFNGKVGFFLHIPFPPIEMIEKFTLMEEILSKLIYSDLISFHIPKYMNNFLDSLNYYTYNKSKIILQRINFDNFQKNENLNIYIKNTDLQSYFVKLNEFKFILSTLPIGIDSNKFIPKLTDENISHSIPLKENNELSIFLGVQREDIIKGIVQKLETIKYFLINFPEYSHKIQFIEVIVPSREKIKITKKLRKKILKKVSKINGKFGDEIWTPIKLIYRPIKFDRLKYLYKNSHFCIVNSLIDGMNLVAVEYLASQDRNNPGVLLLSKFAGYYEYLNKSSIGINPYDIKGNAENIKICLDIKLNERKELFHHCEYFINSNVSNDWADMFFWLIDKEFM